MWAVPVAVCWVVVVSLLIRLSLGFLMVVPVSVVAGYGVDVYVFRADRTVPQFLHGQISWRVLLGTNLVRLANVAVGVRVGRSIGQW